MDLMSRPLGYQGGLFSLGRPPPHYKIVFFSPISHTQAILAHLFATFPAHLGRIGNYEQVAFLTRGTGQFLPGPNARPAIGAVGTLERVEEDRVEVLVVGPVREIILALKTVHPYEEVAYDVYKLEVHHLDPSEPSKRRWLQFAVLFLAVVGISLRRRSMTNL
ncbi:hypothetical protein C8R44DRAFT_793793 [Mycena epipterygia]|nr:hypothetical protein C8R44DRAFT_793793 [Mycena epipterygia]